MTGKIETLEVAQELADRVRSCMPDAPPPGSLMPDVQVPEPLKLQAMDMDGLLTSVQQVNKFLPHMVDDMITTFFKGVEMEVETLVEQEDGTFELEKEMKLVPLPVSEKRRIFESLAKFALTDKRLEKEFGLIREVAAANGGSVSLNQFNLLQLREIPGAVDSKLRELAGPTLSEQSESDANDRRQDKAMREIAEGGENGGS